MVLQPETPAPAKPEREGEVAADAHPRIECDAEFALAASQKGLHASRRGAPPRTAGAPPAIP